MLRLHCSVSSLYFYNCKHDVFYFAKTKILKSTDYLRCCFRAFVSNSKLEHVGKLNDCQHDADYDVGQTFLHRVFAYRGVILHPWKACVYVKNRNITASSKGNGRGSKESSTPTAETFYQVLVDARDSANNLAICDVPYLKNPGRENFPLDIIPGMDYVSHNDIIPYTSVESTPVCHDLFDKFLVKEKNQLIGSKTLSKWQELNQLWLEMNNVYIETTENIRVTAIPFFLGVKALAKSPMYWWRYCIRIENLKSESVKLCERHWRIISDGAVSNQSGRGVVGREPIFNSSKPAFQYSSQVYLGVSRGHMWGTYLFEKENGEQFEVCIPAFALESKLEIELDPNQRSS